MSGDTVTRRQQPSHFHSADNSINFWPVDAAFAAEISEKARQHRPAGEGEQKVRRYFNWSCCSAWCVSHWLYGSRRLWEESLDWLDLKDDVRPKMWVIQKKLAWLNARFSKKKKKVASNLWGYIYIWVCFYFSDIHQSASTLKYI